MRGVSVRSRLDVVFFFFQCAEGLCRPARASSAGEGDNYVMAPQIGRRRCTNMRRTSFKSLCI
jgi:hypothetical protein